MIDRGVIGSVGCRLTSGNRRKNPSTLWRSREDALAGGCYGFATAYIRHSPGTPFNSCTP